MVLQHTAQELWNENEDTNISLQYNEKVCPYKYLFEHLYVTFGVIATNLDFSKPLYEHDRMWYLLGQFRQVKCAMYKMGLDPKIYKDIVLVCSNLIMCYYVKFVSLYIIYIFKKFFSPFLGLESVAFHIAIHEVT